MVFARSAYYVRSGVLGGMFPFVVVRNFRDFYEEDMKLLQGQLSTETLTKKNAPANFSFEK